MNNSESRQKCNNETVIDAPVEGQETTIIRIRRDLFNESKENIVITKEDVNSKANSISQLDFENKVNCFTDK